MRVIWAPEAEQDRVDIWDFIVQHNPCAAIRMDQLFSDAAASLVEFPLQGQGGKTPGTRELIPHENYRLVYEIEGQTVWILALVHVARQWPPVLY